jgi:hypothetical protein
VRPSVRPSKCSQYDKENIVLDLTCNFAKASSNSRTRAVNSSILACKSSALDRMSLSAHKNSEINDPARSGTDLCPFGNNCPSGQILAVPRLTQFAHGTYRSCCQLRF